MRVESGAPDTLASIAMLSKTDISEIQPLARSLHKFMVDLLDDVIPADGDFSFPDGHVLESRQGFPGLLQSEGIYKALQRLDDRYQQVDVIYSRLKFLKICTEIS